MKKHMIAVLAVLAVTVGCSGRRVYSITYNDSDEALIQGPTEADAGENVSFTLRNEPGEFFVDVTIDGYACRPVSETKEDMTFEFVMPEYDVVIDVERSSRPWLSMDQVTSDTRARQGELLAAFYLEDLRPADGATFLEITLYDFDDEHMRMEVIRSGNTAEEETASYQVPVQIYDRLLETVRQYDMASWEKTGTDYESRDIFCSFFWTEGNQMTRVTTNHMPPDGQQAFDAVENLLALYMEEKDIIR